VRGIDVPNVTLELLWNLFSNFGNIVKMLLLRNKSAVLIEYEKMNYANHAKDYMNNVTFMGNNLKVNL
jgi:hypothetical protein